MLLTTRVTERGGCTVVVVDGELDMGTAEQLRAVLAASIVESQRALVLDLAGLRFCDSAGLATFVAAHNELDSAGRQLIIARPTDAVLRILDLSGLTQVIPTVADPDEAAQP